MTRHLANEFEGMQQLAARLLALMGLANAPLVIAIGLYAGSPRVIATTLAALLVAALPAWNAWKRPTDAATPLIIATAQASYPAIFLYLLQGHEWQMDMHMYFFANLAALALMYHAPAVLLAAGLIAGHHLILSWVMPEWVFEGGSDFPRVMVHAAIVIVETSALIIMIRQGRQRMLTLADLSAEAEAQTEVARAAREQAEASAAELQRSHVAEQDARARQVQAEERAALEARLRRTEAADLMENRLSGMMADLHRAIDQINAHNDQIESLSGKVVDASSHLCRKSGESAERIAEVADVVDRVARSFTAVSDSSRETSSLSQDARDRVQSVIPRFQSLGLEIDAAGEILDLIAAIAAQSHMLALNASIEAARSGESGLGFAVVADEMKAMARRTGDAAASIIDRLDTIRTASRALADAVGETQSAVSAITGSADNMAVALEARKAEIGDVTRVAKRMAHDLEEASHMGVSVDGLIHDQGLLLAQTRDIIRDLAGRSDTLVQGMNSLSQQLKAG